MKLLIINICKEKLHYYEFVKPVEDIIKKSNFIYSIKHYKDIDESVLQKFDKIIICGTSLQDNEFLKNIKKFLWIKSSNKSIFGICGGMEIIGLIFGGKLKRKLTIGYYKINFLRDFLGSSGEKETYHLHKYFIDLNNSNSFEIYSFLNTIPVAIKHKEKEIYGVLFHPEVRNKEIIENFLFKGSLKTF